MKRSHLLWIVLALGVAIWFMTGAGGPEAELRNRLAKVEDLIDKQPGESALASAERANRLRDDLAATFRIDLTAAGGGVVTDPAGLARSFVGFRRAFDRIEVGLEAQSIEIQGANTARMEVRASLVAVGGAVGLSRDAFRVEIRWRREGGDWRMAEVLVVERLDA
jgi:hypothetical protein